MDWRNILALLQRFKTLKEALSVIRALCHFCVDPLLYVDAVAGLLDVFVPRPDVTHIQPLRTKSRNKLTVDLWMTERCQCPLQATVVLVNLTGRIQTAVHDHVRRKGVGRNNPVLASVVLFAPDGLTVHLRGDINLHWHELTLSPLVATGFHCVKCFLSFIDDGVT
ncbi:Uncharacterised protein [Enterobacter hormaechei]|nr:Uncharacterised protein [Enterobacter hormaechei]